ncbi:hypothetical protein NOV72_02816 [Caballeronia novacaledonica]|uniref:Uncharacterized protein n=1 Tax=Caballeronia novacaledonica TaxID=1544861 RepID=A0A2U3I607_9BURK|nr:hypothetical protein NOV72_02816 [Caballeronia novacaledonica]
MLLRTFKWIVLCAVLYCSLRYLGVGRNEALIVSFISLVLGVLNFLTVQISSMMAVIFFCAMFSLFLPAAFSDAAGFVREEIGHVSMSAIRDRLRSAKDEVPEK